MLRAGPRRRRRARVGRAGTAGLAADALEDAGPFQRDREPGAGLEQRVLWNDAEGDGRVADVGAAGRQQGRRRVRFLLGDCVALRLMVMMDKHRMVAIGG